MAEKKSAVASSKATVVQRSPEVRVRVTLEIPSVLADLYEEQAIAHGRLLEDEIMERLRRCQTHTALKPLYLDDDQRRRLEDALEHNISSAEVAIAQILTAVSIQVGDVGVQIPSHVMRRLPSRVFKGETYESVVEREVIHALERFVGLRP